MAIQVDEDGSEKGRVTDDNVIQPFRLEESNLRGRMIRLGSVLDDIILQHDYPHAVSRLIGETASLALLLAAMLKYEGIFTLQIKGDGPIFALMADVTSQGDVRAYASFEREAVEAQMEETQAGEAKDYLKLLGNGHIAFTVDQQESQVERYQGIVELQGDTLMDCVQHYFTQSEQIQTGIKMAVREQGGSWRAGAIMVQYMPEEVKQDPLGNVREDDWRRTMILLETCTDEELLSPNLHSADALYRLFHEDGVRIYDPVSVQHVCRCSRERVINVLSSLPRDELEETCEEEGQVELTCEFCSKKYSFNEQELQEIFEQ